MSGNDSSCVMTLDQYERLAADLFQALEADEAPAGWRVKWEHLGFRGRSISDVRAASLGIDDAHAVIACEHGFEDWSHLQAFVTAFERDAAVRRFEAAADAVVSGDIETLNALLVEDPSLLRARSARRHHATLLHYVAANGVEGVRQRTPPNAVAIARRLLEAGAAPDALADMYDAKCTTLSMLVSSSPPADAGLQLPLAETLLEHGAQPDGPGSAWTSAVATALTFGFLDTARALAARGGPVDDLAIAAGLGRLEDVLRLLGRADAKAKHLALAFAAQHGHAEVLRALLDAGEDPNRYNPEGCHQHSTPLHQAVWANHRDVVGLLVERGARLDLRDTIYDGTPLDWAIHGRRDDIAGDLRRVPPAPEA